MSTNLTGGISSLPGPLGQDWQERETRVDLLDNRFRLTKQQSRTYQEQERGAWSMEHGAWSMEHGAWSMERDLCRRRS
jgi:hypothetical protein